MEIIGNNPKERVRKTTIVLDCSSNAVNTALRPFNTEITTGSPNCSIAVLTPVIRMKDILNSELCNLACLVNDIQRQIDVMQVKLNLFDGVPRSESNNTEKHSDIEHFKSLLDVTQKKLVDLDPIACLLENKPEVEPERLNKVENLIDHLATEVMRRMVSSHQVIVYNIPDSLPIETIKNKVLNGCGMPNAPCECRQLRKSCSNLVVL